MNFTSRHCLSSYDTDTYQDHHHTSGSRSARTSKHWDPENLARLGPEEKAPAGRGAGRGCLPVAAPALTPLSGGRGRRSPAAACCLGPGGPQAAPAAGAAGLACRPRLARRAPGRALRRLPAARGGARQPQSPRRGPRPPAAPAPRKPPPAARGPPPWRPAAGRWQRRRAAPPAGPGLARGGACGGGAKSGRRAGGLRVGCTRGRLLEGAPRGGPRGCRLPADGLVLPPAGLTAAGAGLRCPARSRELPESRRPPPCARGAAGLRRPPRSEALSSRLSPPTPHRERSSCPHPALLPRRQR